MTDAARLKSTIYVGGLDNAVNERILADAFLPFGEIVEISIPKPEIPSSPDPHRGFGYVEFELPGDAKEAIDNMDQSELFGRVIKVAAAKPQKESNEGLGSKTAVWEQEGWLAKHAVSEEDRLAADQASANTNGRPEDPMQGLEGLDVAGPQLA
ncbi:MAG: peptidyl prolyl cis-trans isomerase Cyclophilin [Lasallia pustulata]|uniref:Peptidyl prolyl cis-trans isomerase Cyclophilin n=1 Tax=Lasallia pustulata TaxID=136370 RepID=A0A5M8Q092_9LECA|nr:MAG: peptidyl prolyl cis-trans isomerase Cyclophilin [Lasallia pustulata]